MAHRMRVIQYFITPVVVHDNGPDLIPVGVDPLTILASDIDGFGESFRAQLARQEEDLNAGPFAAADAAA